MMNAIFHLPQRIFRFYADGFRSMTIGRKLWTVIIIKLVVIFGILKIFFFPDLLASRYDNDHDRAEAVRDALTTRTPDAAAGPVEIATPEK